MDKAQDESQELQLKLFSSSVASAIDFMNDKANLPEFQGSEVTTHFCKMGGMAFDMLNSGHPLANGYKAPVMKRNLSMWLQRCEQITTYLFSLKDEHGHFKRGRCHKTVFGPLFSVFFL